MITYIVLAAGALVIISYPERIRKKIPVMVCNDEPVAACFAFFHHRSGCVWYCVLIWDGSGTRRSVILSRLRHRRDGTKLERKDQKISTGSEYRFNCSNLHCFWFFPRESLLCCQTGFSIPASHSCSVGSSSGSGPSWDALAGSSP